MLRKNLQLSLPKANSELTSFETKAHSRGFVYIAGVDEAGRGPLAGPVVAAACIIEAGIYFSGINDSKLLSEKKRRGFFQKLKNHPKVHTSVAVVDSEVIDEINILQATLRAMLQAIEALKPAPHYVLIDGNVFPHTAIPGETIIKGDRRSHSVAAAGILAKETRDDIMRRYGEKYPEYGFEKHKGYGTFDHKEALKLHGPCPIHRRSFAPVRMC